MIGARLAMALAVALVGCGASARSGGSSARQRPSSLRVERVLSSGVLAYQVALDGSRVVTTELAGDFALVVREATSGAETARVEIGPSDYDTTGLVLHKSRAWVTVLDGTVRTIDLDAASEVGRVRLADAATAIAVDDDFVVTGTASGVLCLRRAADLALLQCVRGHSGRISALALRAGTLVSGSWSGEATLWSLPSLRRTWTLDRRGSINDVAISPSGSSIAIARSKKPPVRTPDIERAERKSSTTMVDGAIVEVISIDRSRSSEFRGHLGAVTAVAWLADGSLVSAAWDRKVALWDTARSRLQYLHSGFAHLVSDLASDPEAGRVAAAAWAIEPRDPAVVSLAVELGR